VRLARAGWLVGLGLLAGVPSAAADMELRGLDVRVKLAAQRTLRRPFAAARIRDDLIAGGLSIRF